MRLTILQITEPTEQQLIDLEKLYSSQQLTQQQLAEHLAALPSGTTAWVARFNDRHQAAALLSVEQQTAAISALAVRDFNRRRGIGSYLVNELARFAAAEGAKQLCCELNGYPEACHDELAAFLRQQGFSFEDNNRYTKPLLTA